MTAMDPGPDHVRETKAGMDIQRRGPLLWSQELFWLSFHDYPERRQGGILTFRVTPASTTGEATAVHAVAQLWRTYENLRTIFGGPAEPEQLVLPRDAPSPVEVYDGLTDEAIEQTIVSLSRRPAEIDRRPGFYAAVFTRTGVVVQVVLFVHHILCDNATYELLTRRLSELLSGDGRTMDPVGSVHPIDLALEQQRLEADPEWSGRLTRYRSGLMRRSPNGLFNHVPDARLGASPELMCTCYSTRLGAAVTGLARRYRVTASAVLLGAFAMTLSALTGLPSIALLNVLGSRRAAVRNSIACLFLPTPVQISIDARDILERASKTAFDAVDESMLMGDASLMRLKEITAKVAYARGVAFRHGVNFNFVGVNDTHHDDAPSVYAMESSGVTGAHEMTLYVAADGDRTALRLLAKSAVADEPLLRRCLEAIEHVVLSASTGTADPCVEDLAPALEEVDTARPRTTRVIDNCAVDLDRTARLIRALPYVEDVELSVERHLHAGLRLAEAHPLRRISRDILDIGVGHEWFMRPRHIAIEHTEGRRWRRPAARKAGAANTRALDVLTRAVAAGNPGIVVDPDVPYCAQGGRMVAVPGILGKLWAEGLMLSEDDLWGIASLHALAARAEAR